MQERNKLLAYLRKFDVCVILMTELKKTVSTVYIFGEAVFHISFNAFAASLDDTPAYLNLFENAGQQKYTLGLSTC